MEGMGRETGQGLILLIGGMIPLLMVFPGCDSRLSTGVEIAGNAYTLSPHPYVADGWTVDIPFTFENSHSAAVQMGPLCRTLEQWSNGKWVKALDTPVAGGCGVVRLQPGERYSGMATFTGADVTAEHTTPRFLTENVEGRYRIVFQEVRFADPHGGWPHTLLPQADRSSTTFFLRLP